MSLRRPFAEFNSDFLQRMSEMINVRVKASEVDKTGKAPKFLLASRVTYAVEADGSGVNMPREQTKNAYMSIGIPEAARISCIKGMPDMYANPAVRLAHYNVEGGIKDAAADVAFFNRVVGVTGCFGTAAAMQMAYYYTQGYVLPKLGLGGGTVELPGVNNDNKDIVDKEDISSYMANELELRHKKETLTLVYHAMESKEVLAAAGYDRNVKRVMNRCGILPPIELGLETFYEAYFVLRHSLCGDEDGSQFDCDFLVALAQMFSVHGVSDEGGIWRRMFDDVVVQPNSLVATSTAKPFSFGYGVVEEGSFIGGAAKLQCLVARSVAEMDQPLANLVLPPGATDGMIAEAMTMHRRFICDQMASATGLSNTYWLGKIGNRSYYDNEPDRHISATSLNLLTDACPFLSTYCHTNVNSVAYGAVEYNRDSGVPVKFTGSYSIETEVASGEVLYKYSTHERRNFSNGLMFLDPKLNQNDGLMELVMDSFAYEQSGDLLQSVPLADGQELSEDETLGSKMWQDNGDWIPCAGELRTMKKGVVYLKGYTVPKWAEGGKYTITATRYVTLGHEDGEGDTPDSTRRQCANKRSGYNYTVLKGKARVAAPTLTEFFMKWRRDMGRTRKLITSQLAKAARARTEWAKKLTKYTILDPAAATPEEKNAIVEEWTDRVKKVDELASEMAKSQMEMISGGLTPISEEAKNRIEKMVSQQKRKFRAVSASDLVLVEGDGARASPSSWGLHSEKRSFNTTVYLQELDVIKNEVLQSYTSTYRSARAVVHVLCSRLAQEKMDEDLRETHAETWSWGDEIKELIKQAEKDDYNPSAASAKQIALAVVTTSVPEPTEPGHEE